MFDAGGWDAGIWLMIVIDLAALISLGAAIAYGSRMWRDGPMDAATVKVPNRATRRLYHSGNNRPSARGH